MEARKVLQKALEKNLNFALYRLPGEDQAQWVGTHQTNCTTSNIPLEQEGFIFHPFTTAQAPILFLNADYSGTYPGKRFSSFAESGSPNKKTENLFKAINKKEYISTLLKAKAEMTDKKIDKFIFSRVEKSPALPTFKIHSLFEWLSTLYPDAMVYLFNHHSEGLWMGATPEVFLSKGGAKLTTHSLAGTQSREEDNNYKWGKKERDEQAYVTRFIEETLQKQEAHYEKNGPFTAEAGPVAHLKTVFSIQSKTVHNINELIKDLHPTPAVCGLPKDDAFHLILHTEKHERKYYTGFLGPVKSSGDFNLYVNLRSMYINSTYMNLFLGGGITTDSDPESEWEETCLKAQTLTKVIDGVSDS